MRGAGEIKVVRSRGRNFVVVLSSQRGWQKGLWTRPFSPVASEDLSVFYFLHFSSLTVLLLLLLLPFFIPNHAMFTTGESTRGGGDACLIKFASENVFGTLRPAEAVILSRWYYIRTIRGLIFRKFCFILVRRLILRFSENISSKESIKKLFHIILFTLVIDISNIW